jgi:hypothetical protein
MNTVVELQYTLQWEDARLWRHPCFGALQQMLSLGVEAGRSDNARYAKQRIRDRFFDFRLNAEDVAPGFDLYDQWATFVGSTQTTWMHGYNPIMGSTATNTTSPECTHCITRTAQLELEVLQKRFDFFCARQHSRRATCVIARRLSRLTRRRACCVHDRLSLRYTEAAHPVRGARSQPFHL